MKKLTLMRSALLNLGSVMILALGACSTETVDSDTHSNTEGGRPDATGGAADDGEGGEQESGGTDRGDTGGTSGSAGETSVTAGAAGDSAGGTGGAQGGTAGTAGATAGTAGAAAGTAGAAAGTAGAAAGTAGTAGAAAGTAGTAGAAAGTAGTAGAAAGTAGTAGAAAGAGGDAGGPVCFGEETTLTVLPSLLCGELSYATTVCDGGSYGGPLAMQRCLYFAANARPGVFEALYTCLRGISGDACSSDAEAAADDCVWSAMDGACKDVAIYPAYPDTTCEWLVNGDTDQSGEYPYLGCSDIVAGGTADEAIAVCNATFSAFNEAGRAQIYDCYACQVVAEDLTCGEQFEECALPDLPVTSVVTYPYVPDAGTCD